MAALTTKAKQFSHDNVAASLVPKSSPFVWRAVVTRREQRFRGPAAELPSRPWSANCPSAAWGRCPPPARPRRVLQQAVLESQTTSQSQSTSAPDDMRSLHYWAQVANMCVAPMHEIEDFFGSTDEQSHYTEVLVKEIPSVKQRMVLHVNHTTKTVTVAIRGTKNLTNMRSNLKFQQSSDFIGGVRVHRGYLEVAMDLDRYILPHLRTDYSLCLTGHSAGGAVSVLLAMHYSRIGLDIEQVVTFGAPKVGGLKAAHACANLPIVRVADINDVIPMLPTANFRQRHHQTRYYHVGQAVMIDESQPYVYAQLPRTEAKLIQKLDTLPSVMARVLKSDMEQLKSHKMARYVETLRLLASKGSEVSPETLRGFALGSDVRSRRLVQIPTALREENFLQRYEEMELARPSHVRLQDDAIRSTNKGLLASALRKLSSRQRSRLSRKSAAALKLKVKKRLVIPSLVARSYMYKRKWNSIIKDSK